MTGSLCLVILRRLRKTSLGFCLRVIVNEFYPNLESHIEERVLESRGREGKNNDISDKTLKLNKLFWVLFRV